MYELLSRSLVPFIWGMDDVKKGILLQLFGGTNISIARGGGGGGPRYREDINVPLVNMTLEPVNLRSYSMSIRSHREVSIRPERVPQRRFDGLCYS